MENISIEKSSNKAYLKKLSETAANYHFCEGEMLKYQKEGSNMKTFDISYIKMGAMAKEQFNLYVKMMSKMPNLQESESIREYIKHADKTPCMFGKELEERISQGRFGTVSDFENSWNCISVIGSWLTENFEEWLGIFGGFENLKELTVLDLSMFNDSQIPDNLELLQKLEFLDLGNKNITKLPHSVLELSSLTTLFIEDSGISSLPDTLDKLTNLEFISLHCSEINSLPKSILNLEKLETVILQETNIDEDNSIVLSLLSKGVDVVF